MKINLNLELEVDNIVNELYHELDYEGLVNFVKKLDQMVADSEFTKEVYKYFKEERKKDKENGHL